MSYILNPTTGMHIPTNSRAGKTVLEGKKTGETRVIIEDETLDMLDEWFICGGCSRLRLGPNSFSVGDEDKKEVVIPCCSEKCEKNVKENGCCFSPEVQLQG